MLTDHTCIDIFLSWMMNSYSYAVKIFLHVAGGSINMNPIPPQVGRVRPKTTMCPEIDSMPFFRLWLELSLDVNYIGFVRCTWGTGLSPKELSYYYIPNTNTIRSILTIRQNVLGHLFWLCVAQVIFQNCINHTARGFWKFKNSAQCAYQGKVKLPLALNSTLNRLRSSFKAICAAIFMLKFCLTKMLFTTKITKNIVVF